VGSVVLRLDSLEEQAIRHELSEPYGQQVRGEVMEQLRAALDSLPVEEEPEFRVDSLSPRGRHTQTVPGSREYTERLLEARRGNGHRDLRLQSRTIATLSDGSTLTSPWTDVSGEGDGDDG